MKIRNLLKSAGLFLAVAFISLNITASNPGSLKSSGIEESPVTEFPALPYAYNALEPYIDAMTMEIHYDKHHRAYFTNFVNAIKGTPLESMTLSDIFASMSKQSDAVRNNGGGFYNHVFFWNSMGTGSTAPSAELTAAINKAFGSFDKFKEVFNTAAKTRFGSGWAWLYVNADKNLAVGSTPYQDNPLMDNATVKGTPLLALDVWEHAYYLKYQNRRPEYIDAFWNVVNWNEVNKRFAEAGK
ncbi:MAG: superoxide dismutase [Bacteroidales bacterium]|nr:superoxide dismutase [Bacteroidales bacterium]